MSGLNVGYWSPYCEQWFQKRLAEINAGRTTPFSAKDWKDKVVMFKGAPRFRNAMTDATAQHICQNVLNEE